jgi:HEAT repeat protein
MQSTCKTTTNAPHHISTLLKGGPRGVPLLLLLLLTTVAQAADNLALLTDQLTTGAPKQRALAHQKLSHQGADAVPFVLPLLQHSDPVIQYAAFDILKKIGNTAAAPGHEAERRIVAGQLLTLVAPTQPEPLRIKGLRLLERMAPDGVDITPIGAMLTEPDPLRDKARTALERIATPQARQLLRNALATSDTPFQCALLYSLAQLEDEASLPTIEPLLTTKYPAVRVAAATAVAWTGDPHYAFDFGHLLADTDAAIAHDALDAYLKWLEAMVERGGNYTTAIEHYQKLLQSDDAQRVSAALAGLGRYGDGTCVPAMLDAIRNADTTQQTTTMRYFATMPGRDVTRALVEAYPDAPESLKTPLIQALGARGDEMALPLLTDAAKDAAPNRRRAAYDALAQIPTPSALTALAQAANKADPEERRVIFTALLTGADRCRQANKPVAAGRAYAAAWPMLETTEQRQQALTGITACPTPETFAPLMATTGNELAPQRANALIAVGHALTAAGKHADALAAFQRAHELNPSLAALESLARARQSAGEAINIPATLGFITKWHLIGPFRKAADGSTWNAKLVDEPKINLAATYRDGDNERQWKLYAVTNDSGIIDLIQAIAPAEDAVAYAVATVHVDAATDARLMIGSDDGVRVWVNDKRVHDNPVDRGVTIDQDRIPIKLDAADNQIIIKILQNRGGWAFCARLATPNGLPLAFTQEPNRKQ